MRDVRKHVAAHGAFIIVEEILGATADVDALMVNCYFQMKREA